MASKNDPNAIAQQALTMDLDFKNRQLAEQAAEAAAQRAFEQKRMELIEQGQLAQNAEQFAKTYSLQVANLEFEKQMGIAQLGQTAQGQQFTQQMQLRQQQYDQDFNDAAQMGFRDGAPTLARYEFDQTNAENQRQFDRTTSAGLLKDAQARGEQQREFDVNTGADLYKYNGDLGERQRTQDMNNATDLYKTNVATAEDKRQFDVNATGYENGRATLAREGQERNLGETQREYNIGATGFANGAATLDREKALEDQRQFDVNTIMNAPRGPADYVAYIQKLRSLEGQGLAPGLLGQMAGGGVGRTAGISNGGQDTGPVASNLDLANAAVARSRANATISRDMDPNFSGLIGSGSQQNVQVSSDPSQRVDNVWQPGQANTGSYTPGSANPGQMIPGTYQPAPTGAPVTPGSSTPPNYGATTNWLYSQVGGAQAAPNSTYAMMAARPDIFGPEALAEAASGQLDQMTQHATDMSMPKAQQAGGRSGDNAASNGQQVFSGGSQNFNEATGAGAAPAAAPSNPGVIPGRGITTGGWNAATQQAATAWNAAHPGFEADGSQVGYHAVSASSAPANPASGGSGATSNFDLWDSMNSAYPSPTVPGYTPWNGSAPTTTTAGYTPNANLVPSTYQQYQVGSAGVGAGPQYQVGSAGMQPYTAGGSSSQAPTSSYAPSNNTFQQYAPTYSSGGSGSAWSSAASSAASPYGNDAAVDKMYSSVYGADNTPNAKTGDQWSLQNYRNLSPVEQEYSKGLVSSSASTGYQPEEDFTWSMNRAAPNYARSKKATYAGM